MEDEAKGLDILLQTQSVSVHHADFSSDHDIVETNSDTILHRMDDEA